MIKALLALTFSAFSAQARPSDEGLRLPSTHLTIDATSIGLSSPSGAALITLRPALRVHGEWLAPADGDCHAERGVLKCALDSVGTLEVHAAPDLRVRFYPTAPMRVESLGFVGTLRLPGAKGWLSNGFQSWSQTGVVALAAPIPAATLQAALQQTGEDEVYRGGSELSWWYTFAGGGKDAFVAGATTAESLKSWVQINKTALRDEMTVVLASGATEDLRLGPGDQLDGEDWFLALGSDLKMALQLYGDRLPSRRLGSKALGLSGWNSWYQFWDQVTPAAVTANAQVLREKFTPDIPYADDQPLVVLDDGWERHWGEWLPNDKFAATLPTMAQSLHDQGLRFGMWLAPLLVDPAAVLAKEHPDWLIAGVTYQQFSWGPRYRVLDVTVPAAAAHLQEDIRRLVSWGTDLLKIDFLFAGALEGPRHQEVTGMQALHQALALIRAAAGNHTLLVGVGAPPLATLSYVDGWRVGGDIAFQPRVFGWPKPTFAFVANQARSIAGRYPFCRITLCDADPLIFHDRPPTEASSAAWVASLTGGAWFLSDELRSLGSEGWKTALEPRRLALGISGTPAAPLDFFPEEIPSSLVSMRDNLFTAEHQVPSHWQLRDGRELWINFKRTPRVLGGHTLPAMGSVAVGD